MTFDPKSAQPVEASKFDPTTAAPSGGFDATTAVELPQASWGAVVQQALPEAKRGAASAVAGVRQGLEDIGVADAGQAAAVRAEIAKERKAELPQNMSLAQEGVLGGLASIPEMAATLLPAVGPATKAMSAGRALMYGLGLAGGAETAREYSEQRQAGTSALPALGHAGVSGAAEIAGELSPLKYVIGHGGEEALTKFLGNFLGREVLGEEITYAMQAANEKLSRNPDMTMGDFARGLATTGIGATVGAGLMGTGIHTVGKAAQGIQNIAEKVGINRELADVATTAEAPSYTPVTEPNMVRPADKGIMSSFQRLRDEKIPPELISEALNVGTIDPAVQVLQPAVPREDTLAAFEDAAQNSPEHVADFIVANAPTLARHSIDVPAEVGRLVDQGKLSEKAGQKIVEMSSNRLANVVVKLATQTQELRQQTKDAQDAFTSIYAKSEHLKATEMGQWGAGMSGALSKLTVDTSTALTQQELEQFGLPPQISRTLGGIMAHAQKRRLTEGLNLLNGFLYGNSSVPTTSLAHAGHFTESFRGLLQGVQQYSNDVSGQTISYGPNVGTTVKSGIVNSLKPGSVNMIVDGVDPKLARRYAAILRQWVQKYSPNMAVILKVQPNLTSNGHAGHQWYNEEDTSQGKTVHEIVVVVKPEWDTQYPIRTLSHEFGHAMMIHMYSQANKEMQESLRQMWVKDVLTHWDEPLSSYQNAQRAIDPREAAKMVMPVRTIVANQLAGDNSGHKYADYWLNFFEWHAYKFERMLAADYAGMQEPIRKYFRVALHKLRQFFTNEHRLWNPTEEFKEWLRIAGETARIRQLVNQRKAASFHQLATNLMPVSESIDIGGVVAADGLAPIMADNERQITPTAGTADTFVGGIKALGKALKRASPENGTSITKDIIRFNESWAYWLGSFQILGLNKGVPGAERFLNALRAKLGYKSFWLRGANQTADSWERLGKEQAQAVSKLLLTEAETDTWFSDWQEDPTNPGHYIFLLDPAKAEEFGVTEDGAKVYQEVRNMYMRALDAMEQLGKERLVRQFKDDPSNPQLESQLRELESAYANMRDRPYTPFSRFGKFYTKIKANDNGIFKDPITGTSKFYHEGATVYFETYETAVERDAALGALKDRYGKSKMLDAKFNTGKIHDIVYSVRNLPPQFIRTISERLNLSDEQLQEYNEIVKDLAADTSFIKHMKRKANISGYSPDTLRGFADYFKRFSNNYAKVKSAPEFEAAMSDVRTFKRQLEDGQVDTTKLDEFYNWMQKTFNYVMNPGNELAEFKSFFSAWYLGFNVPTAVQNITQLAFWTLPYLSKRFGTLQATGALKTAVRDVTVGWNSLTTLTDDEKAVMTYALEQGFIDESYATTLAQYSEGTALSRLTATATRHRVLNWYNHKAMYMFQLAEEVNRRASLLAAYRLNRSEKFVGAFDQKAFLAAREAVEVTQNEYALENRPEFMRGNKSVVFQFMHYVQNAIFRMTPWGDESWKRLLLVQLAVGGMLGLPFAEDILNAMKFLARKFGIQFEPELEIRELLRELDVAPEIIMRGITSHTGPFDLSYRYSLGQVIPGMSAVASNKRFNDAVTEAVGDVGGAGASVVLNAFKAVANINDPDKWRTAQYIMPSFMKYVTQAVQASQHEGIATRNGAMIAPLGAGEILGMGIGLQPAAKAEAYTRIGFESEIRAYWLARRTTLSDAYAFAMRAHDREAIADVRKHLVEYNKDVRGVDSKLILSQDTLNRSLKKREIARKKQEQLGSPYNTRQITRRIQEAVPQESDAEE